MRNGRSTPREVPPCRQGRESRPTWPLARILTDEAAADLRRRGLWRHLCGIWLLFNELGSEEAGNALRLTDPKHISKVASPASRRRGDVQRICAAVGLDVDEVMGDRQGG